MKALRAVLICAGAIVLAKLGIQAIIAVATAAFVMTVGPRRLRSLPRDVRESGAAHLLTALASGVLAVVLSVFALFAGCPEQSELASLGAWLFVGAMLLVLSFHYTTLEVCPRPQRRIVNHGEHTVLPKAS